MSQARMIYNGQAVNIKDIPVEAFVSFRSFVVDEVKGGARIVCLFGVPQEDQLRIFAVLAHDASGAFSLMSTEVKDAYPALTPDCAQAHWFEREIAEQWGVVPQGHPWLKPIRFHHSYRSGKDAWGRSVQEPILPSVTNFFQVDGPAIHEVSVGPVHAGIIEPGHFRFQCQGENILNLEISLGYQHRGIEPALEGGPHPRTIHHMETLAGDTTIGHALAYCQAVEALSGCHVPARAEFLRGIALELERLANHTGDLGAMANDVGFLPTASYCGRLRGDFLNMTALICGNRFGRGLVRPGGTAFDMDDAIAQDLKKRVERAGRDVDNAVHLLWDDPWVIDRFETTGVVSQGLVKELGLVGLVARASGFERDVRFDFSTGIYRLIQIPVSTYSTGDVFARAYVRWLEIKRSIEFIKNQLVALPPQPVYVSPAPIRPDALVVSLVEGWRGEICHVAMTNAQGQFARYKVVDPSFHNWAGLAIALRQEQISDFPLCNKSFNLSYCGHDL